MSGPDREEPAAAHASTNATGADARPAGPQWALGPAGFHALIQHSSDIITVHDRAGTLLFGSSPGRRILGYPAGALEGSPVWGFVHPDDVEAVRWAFEDVAERQLSGTQVQYRFRTAEGAWRHFESVGNNLLDHPEVGGIVVTTRDVTDRREAEHEQARLSIAIEQADDVVVVTDARWRIQYVNPAFEHVSGYPSAAALGQTPRFLDAGLHDESFYLSIWETLAEGCTWVGRFTIRRQDGTQAVQDASISPIRAGTGEVTSYVVVSRDLSQQLALEEQLRQAQKMELVGQLAGGIAHDFNNLLSPILGYAELVLAGLAESDPRHRQVRLICEATERAGTLSRQLLGFSRRQSTEIRTFDLGTVVRGFVRILRRTIREDIDLQLRVAAPEGWVRGDASQVEQVLMNLVVNAQDAIPGAGTIVIETDVASLGGSDPVEPQNLRPGPYVLLRVTDSGTGMTPEVQRRIFEPFFTTKEAGRGTGLGLANVRGIVEQHHGAVTVESHAGRGTTFRVYLPRVEPVKDARPAEGPVTSARGTERIVVVEDETLVRELTCSILRLHGYDVQEYTSADACLEAAAGPEARPAALLVTDVIMPGMNGRQLFERLQLRWPALSVVYMSGYTDDVMAGNGREQAGTDFLQKPFSVRALARAVREVLDRTGA